MNPIVRQKVAEYLEKHAFRGAIPYAARAGQFLGGAGRRLMSRPGLVGAGVLGGAGGMYGLREMGLRQQRAEQEAEELRQLLAAYPELLNEPMYAQPDPYEALMMQQQYPMY